MAKALLECESCHRTSTFDDKKVANLRTVRCKHCGTSHRQEKLVYPEGRPVVPKSTE